tara:strand:+ start:197 stop:838 length:642 start_codon:yes stop_codon:yes gene_type:complete
MKFAIVLAGCGQHDGSETHEVVLTLLSLAQESIEWDAFAPDIDGAVVNHLSNKATDGKRRILDESARLVRGNIKNIKEACVAGYDAIIIPGGFGAVSNLCNWGVAKEKFSLNLDFHGFMEQVISLKKPIGFICIAPMMIPYLYQDAILTIGNDKDLAREIADLGGKHIDCNAEDIVIDQVNKIISTPANMVGKGINSVYKGIHKLVVELKAIC